MKKTAFIFSFFIACFCTSCKKDGEEIPEQCWLSFTGDMLNNTRSNVNGAHCNMTEEEFLNCTDCGYNGKVRDFVSACDYRDIGVRGPKTFYWEVKFAGTANYTGDYYATEKEAECFLGKNGNVYRKK